MLPSVKPSVVMPSSSWRMCFRLRWSAQLGASALSLTLGARWCLGLREGGGEQVAGRQAAVGAPFVGDGEDLLLGGEVVEPVGGLDGLAYPQAARHDNVFPAEQEQGRPARPRWLRPAARSCRRSCTRSAAGCP